MFQTNLIGRRVAIDPASLKGGAVGEIVSSHVKDGVMIFSILIEHPHPKVGRIEEEFRSNQFSVLSHLTDTALKELLNNQGIGVCQIAVTCLPGDSKWQSVMAVAEQINPGFGCRIDAYMKIQRAKAFQTVDNRDLPPVGQ